MNGPMPQKPEYKKGIIIYSIVAAIFVLLIVISSFSSKENVDWNRDGVINIKDDIYHHNSMGDYSFEANLWATAILFPLVFSCPTLFYTIYYIKHKKDYELAITNYPAYLDKEIKKLETKLAQAEAKQAEIDAEYEVAVKSQQATEPWAKRYSTSPCPYCGHYKVRNAKWEDKSLSVAFWGVASSAIGKNYKCEYCNRMWE